MRANADEEQEIVKGVIASLIAAGHIPEKPCLGPNDKPHSYYKPDREDEDDTPNGAHPNVFDAESPCDCPRCIATRTGMVILPRDQHENFGLGIGNLPQGSHRLIVGEPGGQFELIIVPVSLEEYTAYVVPVKVI